MAKIIVIKQGYHHNVITRISCCFWYTTDLVTMGPVVATLNRGGIRIRRPVDDVETNNHSSISHPLQWCSTSRMYDNWLCSPCNSPILCARTILNTKPREKNGIPCYLRISDFSLALFSTLPVLVQDRRTRPIELGCEEARKGNDHPVHVRRL